MSILIPAIIPRGTWTFIRIGHSNNPVRRHAHANQWRRSVACRASWLCRSRPLRRTPSRERKPPPLHGAPVPAPCAFADIGRGPPRWLWSRPSQAAHAGISRRRAFIPSPIPSAPSVIPPTQKRPRPMGGGAGGRSGAAQEIAAAQPPRFRNTCRRVPGRLRGQAGVGSAAALRALPHRAARLQLQRAPVPPPAQPQRVPR